SSVLAELLAAFHHPVDRLLKQRFSTNGGGPQGCVKKGTPIQRGEGGLDLRLAESTCAVQPDQRATTDVTQLSRLNTQLSNRRLQILVRHRKEGNTLGQTTRNFRGERRRLGGKGDQPGGIVPLYLFPCGLTMRFVPKCALHQDRLLGTVFTNQSRDLVGI